MLPLAVEQVIRNKKIFLGYWAFKLIFWTRPISNQECEVTSSDHYERGYEYGCCHLDDNRIRNDSGEIYQWSGPNVYLKFDIFSVVVHMTKQGLSECSTSGEVESLNNLNTRNTPLLPLISYRRVQQQVLVEKYSFRTAGSKFGHQSLYSSTNISRFVSTSWSFSRFKISVYESSFYHLREVLILI